MRPGEDLLQQVPCCDGVGVIRGKRSGREGTATGSASAEAVLHLL